MSAAASLESNPTAAAGVAVAGLASVGRPTFAAKEAALRNPFRELTWEAIGKGWKSQREEFSYFINSADIEGEIPAELVGTVLRNGPGIDEVYGTKLKHHIDGDGLICALTFLPDKDGSGKKKVHFRSRFVRSQHHIEEEHERRFLYRGQMGTQMHSWVVDSWNTLKDTIAGRITPLNYRNPSNTNVVYWGGKVLSLYETGLPYAMDPRTLHTLGPDNLGGALKLGAMAAHFRYDSVKDTLTVISLRPGLRNGSALAIVEFDRQWNIIQQQQHRIPFLNYAHDFALFAHYYVFHITPFVKISKEKVLEIASGMSSPGEQMKYYPDLPCRMVVIPRDVAKCTEYRTFEVDPCHIFHFSTTRTNYKPDSQCGPSDVDSLEFSAVCLPKKFAMFPVERDAFLSNAETAPGKLCHFTLKFGAEKTPVHQRVLDDSSCEFPTTHPYRNGMPSRYSWMMANARGNGLPFRDVVKVDEVASLQQAASKRTLQEASTHLPKPDATPPLVTPTHKVWASYGIVGEPIFIPRRTTHEITPEQEDDGWIFVQVSVRV